MTNSSINPGYLVQTDPPHVADQLDSTFVLDQSMLTLANSLDDDDLFNFFHDFIAGLTGLAGNLVLPRWQPEPPNIPATAPNFAAFGVTTYKADTYAADVLKAAGTFEIHRHETIELLVSFFGLNCGALGRIFRDGIQVEQNRDVLSMNNFGLLECNDVVMAPTLFKERWLRRADVAFSVRRQVVRGFPVQPLVGAIISVNNEKYSETINV